MEENTQIPQQSEPTIDETTISSQSSSGFSGSPMRVIAFLFVALVAVAIIAGVFFARSNNNDSNTPKEDEAKNSKFESIAPNVVVYGYWKGDNTSRIDAANLQTGDIFQIATLPSDIKKVTVTSSNSLIFIQGTDVFDHGTSISSYNIKSGKAKTLISAADGFGIDDYVVSPNKRYIAIWEVSVPQNQNLSTGRSRVYTVDLNNPSVKNLIYNENIPDTTLATYPVGITDTGEVFMDTFKPNSGAGWANGMFVSDFRGTTKGPIDSMPSGTYGTQPQLSPDGKYLAFAGFSGSGGNDSLEGGSDGFRKALLSPNTVELLDTATKKRTVLVGVKNANTYPVVRWDASGKLYYFEISEDESQMGFYSYDINAARSEKIYIGANTDELDKYYPLYSVSSSQFLLAQKNDDYSAFGNLGNAYGQLTSAMASYDKNSGSLVPVTVNQPFIQVIDIVSQNYFSNLKAIGRVGEESSSTEQLQLDTFVLKPTLKPVRITQQSEPPSPKIPACLTLQNQQCGDISEPRAADKCRALIKAAREEGKCGDSPLYLYGNKGQNVSISVNTPIYDSNANHNKGLYSGILIGDGGINIDGSAYSSIDYAYMPAIRKLPRMDYGKTVKARELASTIKEFGSKLGLNQKEIEDLIKKIDEENIDKPYVFISFYSDEISKAILPISFDPNPDVYRNIVFYLKPVDEPIIAKSPKFSSFTRTGFTAVEVSYIFDK